jgi:hypothetical protein
LFVFGVLTGEDFTKEVLGLEEVMEDKASAYKIVS